MSSVDRYEVLLADRAIWGQTRQAERDGLDWELTAGAVTAALLGGELERPPADLLRRVRADALAFLTRDSGTAQVRSSLRPSRLLAAALLLVSVSVAVSVWGTRPPSGPTVRERLSALLDRQPADLIRLGWQPGPSGPGAAVGGEIVWSDAVQEGYMRFEGLRPNDPSTSQYQLWIFDAERPDAFPVDGGVFDISSIGEDSLVPVHAKIRVHDAVMFAVTVEKPGGVVVSGREQIVVLATL